MLAPTMIFRDKLPRLLELRGLSQAELARRTGLRPTLVNKWLREGNRGPTGIQFLAVARALRVPVDYLIDDEADNPPPPIVSDDEVPILELVRSLRIDRGTALAALARAATSGGSSPPEVKLDPVGPGREVYQRNADHLLRREILSEDPEINRGPREVEPNKPQRGKSARRRS